MAKKKKTRKQKVLSEKRHLHISPSGDATPTDNSEATKQPQSSMFVYRMQNTTITLAKTPGKTTSMDYTHIAHDLRKTTLLTIAIVAVQLALYWFIK